MIGLAIMACKLAEQRTGSILLWYDGTGGPLPRESLESWMLASTEYYAIIDRLTRGEPA
jgi:hypothetical protein